jgi:hypothetical protein
MRRPVFVLFLVTLGVAAGCSSPDGNLEDLASRTEPRLSSIQRNVFDVYCAQPGCHAGFASESLLNLEAGNAYENLVEVPSAQMPDLRRVAPFRADDSYLIRKLEANEIVGEPMPRTDIRLPQEAIDVIREWIDNGAPSD